MGRAERWNDLNWQRMTTLICIQIPKMFLTAGRITYQLLTIQGGIRFCGHFERNSRVARYHKLWRKMKHAFYAQCRLFVGLTVFDIIKQKEENAPQLLRSLDSTLNDVICQSGEMQTLLHLTQLQ
jgi:hypothetical protein